MDSPRHKSIRWVLATVIILLFLAALFTVPYHFAVPHTISDSEIFGYNNRVAVLIVILGALWAGIFFHEPQKMDRGGKPLGLSTLWKALLIVLAFTGTISILTQHMDGVFESGYMIDRVKLAIAGHVAYRDFEFIYGPLLVYGPATLAWCFHLTARNACNFFWMLLALAGVLQLYSILRWTDFSAATQRRVFGLVFLLSLSPLLSNSTSYVLFRFLTPIYLAMAIARLVQKSETHASILLWSVPSVALATAVSPEAGMTFCLGIILYLLCFTRVWQRSAYLISFAVSLAGMSGVFWVAAKLGIYRTLLSMQGGAYNFPLMPTPHLLIFLVAVGIAATYVVTRFRRGEATPLTALCCVALATLPAALGRCDLGHVLVDGLGIFICAFLVADASNWRTRLLLPATCLIYFVLPVLSAAFSILAIYGSEGLTHRLVHGSIPQRHPQVLRWVSQLEIRIHGREQGLKKVKALQGRLDTEDAINVPAIFHEPPATVFLTPFPFYGDHTGPYHSASIDSGYFLGQTDVFTSADVTRIINWLASHPEDPLLVPEPIPDCTLTASEAEAEIRQVFRYPYHHHASDENDDVLRPLCSFVQEHYARVTGVPAQMGVAVWKPISSSETTSQR